MRVALKAFSLAAGVLKGFDNFQSQLDDLKAQMEEFKIMCLSVERILEAHHAPRGKERRKGFKEIWEVLGERRN